MTCAAALLLAVMFGIAPLRAAAFVSHFTPVKDATLFEDASGALASGKGTGLFAGKNNNGLVRRALLAFDLSSIPATATVTRATLTLDLTQSNSTTVTLQLRRVTAGWGEGASDADSIGGGGMGAPAQTGDATWIHAFFSSTFWAQPGGNFAAAPRASLPANGLGFYTFGIFPRARL